MPDKISSERASDHRCPIPQLCRRMNTLALLFLSLGEFGVLLTAAVVLFAAARIARQAGYSGWWCIAMLLPIVNLAVLVVFALARWPATEARPPENRQNRR